MLPITKQETNCGKSPSKAEMPSVHSCPWGTDLHLPAGCQTLHQYQVAQGQLPGHCRCPEFESSVQGSLGQRDAAQD